MPGLLIAVDQGTTNTKALLVESDGNVVYRVSVPVALYTPQPGFVEQDAMQLWTSVSGALRACAEEAARRGGTVEGIALSNQRETAIAWERPSGQPLAPAVSWQCRRSTHICERVRPEEGEIQARSGLPLDPLMTASKWTWMLENLPAVADARSQGTLCLGTVDSWLLWRLTHGAVHATDTTNASRTGLLNLNTLRWDPELLALFRVPLEALPQICASSSLLGRCAAEELPSVLQGVPVLAMLGDSHAALAGYGVRSSGITKATYGTGSSVMALSSRLAHPSQEIARTVAWTLCPTEQHGGGTDFALEGNICMAGAAVQWLGEFLALPNPAQGAAALSTQVSDSEGLYFVPAMLGLGAPHWDAQARGLLCGLERSHTAAHLARAAVEAIAYQVADLVFAIEKANGHAVSELYADGGASRNDQLMQFQADLLGIPVVRSRCEELSALGAARLAALHLGWQFADEGDSAPKNGERFLPKWSEQERKTRYAGWQRAAQCSVRFGREQV